MKVQHVPLVATKAALDAGCVGLTPELLAATGARYSRSNEGLHAIVSRIDWKNPDASVDGIFRMVDYGHASIADMAPVAMFIDGLSILSIFMLWHLSPTASGQESSSRYINFGPSGVPTAFELGIKNSKEYTSFVKKAFSHYNKAVDIWTKIAKEDPSIMGIPKEVVEDTSEKGQKRLDRMRRNFAFDRARVYLPVCAKSNVMLIMSARSWVELISVLLSHPHKELQTVGKKLKEQLALVTPRLIKHAVAKPETSKVLSYNRELLRSFPTLKNGGDGAYLRLYEEKKKKLDKGLRDRINRYSLCGDDIRMIPVTFGWKKIAFAEVRDLNRHRTGQRRIALIPNGFYDASEQAPTGKIREELQKLSSFGNSQLERCLNKFKKGDVLYPFFTLLGHTYWFEHTTTLDKYIYEAELRTGMGAHYRYAMHLRNTLGILYRLHPELKGVIKEGRGEPE